MPAAKQASPWAVGYLAGLGLDDETLQLVADRAAKIANDRGNAWILEINVRSAWHQIQEEAAKRTGRQSALIAE